MILPPHLADRSFLFQRDTFTFANELVWQYRYDPRTGAMTTFRNPAPPAYSHRCFVMVRSARQFFYHARFEPDLPVAEPDVYRRLIREVVERNPRQPCPEQEQIVIPGYDCLRSFSQACEPLLKAGCGRPWESYFLRSHWRMVHPIWRSHQERMAQQLIQAMRLRRAPLVHLFLFPRIRINHGIVLFGLTETDDSLRFEVYDPNMPDSPTQLNYDKSKRTFFFPRNQYWAGGALNLYEIYSGGLY